MGVSAALEIRTGLPLRSRTGDGPADKQPSRRAAPRSPIARSSPKGKGRVALVGRMLGWTFRWSCHLRLS